MDIPLGQALNRATCLTCYILPSTIKTSSKIMENWFTDQILKQKKPEKTKPDPAGSYISALILLNTASAYTTTVFSVIQHSLLPFCRIAAILCAQSRQPTIF